MIKNFEKLLEINDEIAEIIEDDIELEQHTDEATEFEIKVRNEVKIIYNFIVKKSETIEPLIAGSSASAIRDQICGETDPNRENIKCSYPLPHYQCFDGELCPIKTLIKGEGGQFLCQICIVFIVWPQICVLDCLRKLWT